jgi:RsiW-degrading membrane proteinase PrsW (M82 family)
MWHITSWGRTDRLRYSTSLQAKFTLLSRPLWRCWGRGAHAMTQLGGPQAVVEAKYENDIQKYLLWIWFVLSLKLLVHKSSDCKMSSICACTFVFILLNIQWMKIWIKSFCV